MSSSKNNLIKREILNPLNFITVASLAMVSCLVSIVIVSAAGTTQLSQSITGALDVQIVDGSGNAVASPTAAFPAKSFAMTYQTSATTLGTASEKMRVTNPSGTTDTWTLSIAATSGATALWTNGTKQYDFNDTTASAGDGADTDSAGGQMTIDPSGATITGVGGTAITNISKGTVDSFAEGGTDSIDLMSASAGAVKPGQWDLTGISLSQSIPGAQASGSYTLDLAVTVI